MTKQVSQRLGLFEGFGVELEYMIVDKGSLAIRPISDEILFAVGGSHELEVERGPLAWSNELVLHVIELKVNGPATSLEPLPALFQSDISVLNRLLDSKGAMLLPTGMHPLMNPLLDTQLWPHEQSDIYDTFDRIFDCRGHGWSNLQSCHLNLPFASDEEFGKLHAAIRLVLPLIPMLAASSPIQEGQRGGPVDLRLQYYRANCARLPSVTGRVIPERVFTEADYEREILAPIALDIVRFDAQEVLEARWVNARGAIARFDRGSIEIRLVDIQECPEADLAILAFVTALVRGLVQERWLSCEAQKRWDERELEHILVNGIERGSRAILPIDYARSLGSSTERALPASALLPELLELLTREGLLSSQWSRTLGVLFAEATLAERILRALGSKLQHDDIVAVYKNVADCLARGQLFRG